MSSSGQKQAIRWLRVIHRRHPNIIYSSPEPEMTAIAARFSGGKIPVHMRTELRARNYGSWAGQSWRDLQDNNSYFYKQFCNDPDFAPPSGDSHNDLVKRADSLLADIADSIGRSVIIGHPEINRIIMARAIKLPYDELHDVSCMASEVCMIRHTGRGFDVKAMGEDLSSDD
jgi:broad specificity phosphatase PhoE